MGEEFTSAEVGGFNIDTNSGESAEEIQSNLQAEEAEEEESSDLSDAASELGKKGGKAAAKARKAKTKEAKAEESTEAEEAESPDAVASPAPEGDEESVAEGDDEEKAEEKAEEKPKRDRSARGRVLEATRQAAQYRSERDEAVERNRVLESRLDALERRLAAPAPQGDRTSESKPSEASQEPSPERFPRQVDEFNTWEEYEDAKLAWNRQQTIKEFQEQSRRQSQIEAQDRRLTDQVERFKSSVNPHLDSFSDEVLMLRTEFQLREGEHPNGGNWIANELFASPESAPTLMRYFTEHADELQRVAALRTPREVSREMAKLEARLEVATAGTPDTSREEVSRAHPPVKPVTGASGIADGDPAPRDGESFDSWYRRTGQARKVAQR